ncbi:MAG: alpha-glucan family phosphorylase [Saprospiraceae bacterium]
MVDQIQDSSLKLKRIFIEARLPEQLLPLQDLAHNIWWTWNQEAIELFQALDPEKWEALHYNPVAVLDQLGVGRIQSLIADAVYVEKINRVYEKFNRYIAQKSTASGPAVAYFSMEFGLHTSIRLYSGGLGVLAGDYIKEASDCNVPFAGISLLYRYGYFDQSISLHGDQINDYPPQEYTKLPLLPVRGKDGEWLKVNIDFPARVVRAKVWMLPVGRVPLYLLDTDIADNSWDDRSITHQLYGGDNEHRLRQEIVLGIGGIRMLEALGETFDIYHCNEGHAAFMGLERLSGLMQRQKLSFETALEAVRASSLFTTHTPVPAGHDYFPEDLLRHYFDNYVHALGISWEAFIGLGRVSAQDHTELFSMSHLAIRLSQEVNGVSRLHGKVSRQMFSVLYPGYNYQELHIGHVTNGVHYPTWIAREWHGVFKEYLGENFMLDQANPANWEGVMQIPDQVVLDVRNDLKKQLLTEVRRKLQEDMTRRGEKPAFIFDTLEKIREDALVIGFARRFATYKRGYLLFNNLDRLREIVNKADRPVLFIYAGKAHPADYPGQQVIKDIVLASRRSEFNGRILFMEGYNMEIAKLLVQGVDIWLNTPTRPKEASGTSGMKAALNGVMNLSVLDGWWAEGYLPDAGWALPLEATYSDPALQDELDAETIYNILENEIIPRYFDRTQEGLPVEWLKYVRNTIAKVGPHFTMKRMLDDYIERYYVRLQKRSAVLREKKYAAAAEIAEWKQHIRERWDGIQLMEKDVFDTDNYSLHFGEAFKVNIKLFTNNLAPQCLGVEAVFFKRMSDSELEIRFHKELKLLHADGQVATFADEILPQIAGVYEFGFRLFPKHELMPHKQDLPLMKWL